nr:hypothetical protein [Hyphomonas sp. Mor2]
MTKASSRVMVTIVFGVIYAAILIETVTLFAEFGPHGLGLSFATLFAHNFLFFPIVGLLALVAFWKPTVMLVDALFWNKVRFGRIAFGGVILLLAVASWAMSSAFNNSNTRSLFEIAPAALMADEGVEADDPALRRASVQEILIKLKINANSEGGLSEFYANCDPLWLEFADSAAQEQTCFPTGNLVTITECCQARTRFREFVNTMQADNPATLSSVHRLVMPVKLLMLFMLLMVGILLVRLRKSLANLYGSAVQDVSFPIAMGGALMLLWPLMNASYLDTFALLTADGSSNIYRVTAPLYALGFGVWVLLLVFFHFRTFPSQTEMALKFLGVVAAGLGVLQYEQIIGYLSRTLGVGGGLVAVVVFVVMVVALIGTLVLGIKPPDFIDPKANPATEDQPPGER